MERQSSKQRKKQTGKLQVVREDDGKFVYNRNFKIEYLLAHKNEPDATGKPTTYYLVKWHNFAIEQSTWEPEEHIGVDNPAVVEYLEFFSQDEHHQLKKTCEEFYNREVAKGKRARLVDGRALLHMQFELDRILETMETVERENVRVKQAGVVGRDKIESLAFFQITKEEKSGEMEVYFKVKWVQREEGHVQLIDTAVSHADLMTKDPQSLIMFYESAIEFSREQNPTIVHPETNPNQ